MITVLRQIVHLVQSEKGGGAMLSLNYRDSRPIY